jgi:hypothetical protein
MASMSSWHAMSPVHQICGPTDVQLLRLRGDDGCAAMAATAMRLMKNDTFFTYILNFGSIVRCLRRRCGRSVSDEK